jgi:protein-disulfide isomerase
MKRSIIYTLLLLSTACDVGTSPQQGAESAQLSLVVYSDFECPYCKVGADRIRKLLEAHPNELKVTFKHRPLPIHSEARQAALASIAAGEQGKFWEYHDRLFASQKALDLGSLERHAIELGLDLEKFRRDMASSATETKLLADEAEAESLGVRGTPTFFLNGKMIQGAQPLETFERAIAEEKALR